MLTYGPPSVAALERFLVSQLGTAYTYPHVGCTLGRAPAPGGFRADHAQALVGHGDHAFSRARAALRSWAMYDLPGIMVYPPETPAIPGGHFTVSGAVGPVWVTGACRVVDVVDEDGHFAIAIGTLSHAAAGEELFRLTHRPDGTVWCTIEVSSRPERWYARVGWPMLRRVQDRFRRHALARIAIAAREESPIS